MVGDLNNVGGLERDNKQQRLETNMRIDTDVLVAGGGPAGLMAAIEAADAGARTVLLEAEPEPGGSGIKSAGHLALCETDLEPGSREELLADLRLAHHNDHDEALAKAYVDNAGIVFRRLKDLGVEYATTVQLAHMSRPWAHEVGSDDAGGRTVVQILLEAARSRGVSVMTHCRLRRLERDKNGKVAKVTADLAREQAEFDVRSGVVLATGGFTRNPELIRNFGSEEARHIIPLTGEGSRGDGLIAALALGAGTSYLHPGIQPTGPTNPATGKGTLMFYCGGVILNKHGRRFVRESEVYNDVSGAGLQQPEGLMIHVFDEQIRQAYSGTIWSRVDALTGAEEISADSLDVLLQRLEDECGLDAVTARKTIANYNDAVRSGVADPDQGRSHLVGSSGELVEIAHPPFAAIVTQPGTTHFNGGIKIDAKSRVIDVFGEPIAGLYAAGEVIGGFHGTGYMSGTQWGQAVIFGHIAGIGAAAHR